ncbi:protein-glutamate O-methyltransferase CheR [Kiloniella sp. EL199]|uniref:CheR family methyltransferase n=1 Tax=Kiloniella sp. EL199 TaxID=2107581 RepID=UPI000EA32E4D|nr:protein-glutamate O-methyltransferase [Kiloniella sp. EL199]
MSASALASTQAGRRKVSPPGAGQEREFPFSDDEFKILSNMVYERAGIVLNKNKKDMVYGRLARRLRKLKIPSFKEYLQYLNSNNGSEETGLLINAITTNLTKFFRESHHFKHLFDACSDIVQAQTNRGEERRLRIWSAGCSSGEEPYSIAIIMNELLKKAAPIDIRVLATDLDTSMLQTGMAGVYNKKSIENLPAKFRSRYTEKLSDTQIKMSQDLRKLITFKQLNLLEKWPMKGPFDAIFCRNVMIYFDTSTKVSLGKRYSEMLRSDSWLYIGHSESLPIEETQLKLIGKTIYQRNDQRR